MFISLKLCVLESVQYIYHFKGSLKTRNYYIITNFFTIFD